MRPMLISAPPIEPVSLAEAKSWLREDGDDEDQLIQALIVSARMTLEAYTRRFFVTQTWRIILDAWPEALHARSAIDIPLAPFQSIAAIRVYDANGTPQTLATASYRAPAAMDGGRVIFNAVPPIPGRSADAIEIDAVVGYGALANQTPEPLRRAMLMLVAYWRERRGADPDDAPPRSVMQLIAPFRRERLT